MSDDEKDDEKVETLKPGQSKTDVSFDKLFKQQTKDSQTALDKQAKTTADAYKVFKTEYRKLKDMEEDHNTIDEDRQILKGLKLDN